MGRRGFLALAAGLAACAVAAFLIYLYNQPKTLRLAVGPLGSEDARMAAAFVQGLNREKSSIRLRLILTEGSAESARRIDAGEVELAILRPDIALPARADTALITRRTYPFFITGKDRGIERVSDLRGRRVGVVRPPQGNVDLLKIVLAQYEVAESEVEIVGLMRGEVEESVRGGRIDAMFAVTAVAARATSDALATMRSAWGAEPVYIPVREADAIAARFRAIETGEIVRGTFGGDPPRPSENLPTISVTSRLMAAHDLDEGVVGDLVSAILALRVTLAAELPSIQGLEAPSTDKDAPLPVHTGAAAFIDGEQKTFFERYGDWFYLGVMALSLFGSGTAGLLGRQSAARRHRAMGGLDRLVEMLPAIRLVEEEAILAGLETEADSILTETVAAFARGHLDSSALAAYRLAMDQVGRATAERRRLLSELPAAAEA